MIFFPTNLENVVLILSTFFHSPQVLLQILCAVTITGRKDQVRHAIIAFLHWRAVCTLKKCLGGTD